MTAFASVGSAATAWARTELDRFATNERKMDKNTKNRTIIKIADQEGKAQMYKSFIV